jgi:ADP-ribose pyrophosphatase YjhB (NUDIX family)
MKFLYVQTDGNVFLVKDGNKLRLPKEGEVPFKIREGPVMKLNGHDIVWCDSESCEGMGWIYRDELLTSANNVDELAKIAAIKSYPRVTAGVFLVKGDKVLLVKPNRGMAKDKWIAPGGFVEYGENPEETVRREAKEETGINVKDVELLAVEKARYESTNYHFVTVFFTGKFEGEPKRKKDEIGEIKWIPVKEAAKLSTEIANKAALAKLAKRLEP